ncbi:SDR family oxidoreductase [Candidatus Moduliflexota bacterium]
MNGKTILFGSSGQLGSALMKKYRFVAPPRSDLDITDYGKVKKYIEEVRPTAIVHAAAMVGAKECEEDKAGAYAANVVGTHNIARVCQVRKIKMIYISTDTVFDGQKGDYREEDTPNPINYYSLTKLLGEAAVKMLDSYLIVRTSFYSPESFKYKRAFTDQYTCRMKVDDLAEELIYALETDVRGLVHIGGEKSSLYEKIFEDNPEIGKITRSETGLDLPRDLSLNTSKWKGIKNGTGTV